MDDVELCVYSIIIIVILSIIIAVLDWAWNKSPICTVTGLILIFLFIIIYLISSKTEKERKISEDKLDELENIVKELKNR